MKIRLTDNLKAILFVLGVCIAFYFVIFFLWNTTNTSPEKKPSSFFWDADKDGYQSDPLYDRKK